jgi:hypothetical protein
MTSPHEIRVIDYCVTAEQLLSYLHGTIFLYDYTYVYSNKYKILLTYPFLLCYSACKSSLLHTITLAIVYAIVSFTILL